MLGSVKQVDEGGKWLEYHCLSLSRLPKPAKYVMESIDNFAGAAAQS